MCDFVVIYLIKWRKQFFPNEDMIRSSIYPLHIKIPSSFCSKIRLLELCVKSIKRGHDCEFNLSREFFIERFSSSCVGAYQKSWVKFLGPLLIIPSKFKKRDYNSIITHSFRSSNDSCSFSIGAFSTRSPNFYGWLEQKIY